MEKRTRLVLHGRVLSGGEETPACRVEVDPASGRIVSVEPGGGAAGADRDAGDGWIVPGLIDLQVNGAGGVDLAAAEDPEEAVAAVARVLARRGVTGFCPTLVSSPEARILRCLPAFAARLHAGGAASLGTHVEGPFISPAHGGVHDPACLRPPNMAEVERWLEVGRPAIVTLAPELPGVLELVERLSRAGVLVSIGHTGASAEQVAAAEAAGARMGTHLFNAMAPLHHRQPGVVGGLLTGRATIGLIVDGVHVDPLVVGLVVRAVGPERITLVSDAVAPAGALPGAYVLGGQTIVSDGRTVRRADDTIGGSALLLDECLRNARAWLPWLTPAQVVMMATEVPAAALGLKDRGRVAPGCVADLAVLDRDWRVTATVVRGELVPSPRGEGTYPRQSPR